MLSTEDADLVGVDEFGKMANRSPNTVRYWVQTGYAPPSGKFGRRRMWRRADVVDWIDQRLAGAGGSTPAGR